MDWGEKGGGYTTGPATGSPRVRSRSTAWWTLGFLALGACPSPSADTADPTGTPTLQAIAGDAGVLLWCAPPTPDAVVERLEEGLWRTVPRDGDTWWDEGAPSDSQYRLQTSSGTTSPLLQPDTVHAGWFSRRPDGAWWNGETAEVDLVIDLPALHEGLQVEVERTGSSGTVWFQAGTWGETPVAEVADVEAHQVLLSAWFVADVAEPETVSITARVRYVADGRDVALEETTLPQHLLGRRVAWGDLHVHTNLSADGCEDEEGGCGDRLDGRPGGDVFAVAEGGGLDFTALTDHAEMVIRYPYRSLAGTPIDLWAEAQRLVQEADGGPVVPVLGYEWTWDDHGGSGSEGGHKTVLLETTRTCDALRVGAPSDAAIYTKVGTELTYLGPNPIAAASPTALWEMLTAGLDACGDTRVLTFSHHTGLASPQPMDWTSSTMAPDPAWEPVVEIYSEHGSSECRSRDAAGCAWQIPDGADDDWTGETGSVQTALSLGYRLGFLAGTDAHDGRAGSTSDGPSCTAYEEGEAAALEAASEHEREEEGEEEGDGEDAITRNCSPFGGGVTGALVTDATQRSALFDALFARRTLASSGPRVAARVLALQEDGSLHLPGDAVPAGQVRLLASASGQLAGDAWLEAIEVVDPTDGSVRTSTTTDLLDVSLDLEPGDVVYVRYRLWVNGEEERIWASPFFAE